MTVAHALRALRALLLRELLRFVQQRGRFFAALVRPLLWLLIFGAGFRAAIDLPVLAPYGEIVPYELYIVPGLIGMVQLFNGMQSSLSMVYDREMGSMRVLLTTPLPRPFLLTGKILAGVAVSMVQVYAFLLIAALFGIRFPLSGYLALIPALIATGVLLGALGLLLSSLVRQLENFAGIMNFVIFPAFFLSSALYPIETMRASSNVIALLCALNPFTFAVELLRFALHLQIDGLALAVVLVTGLATLAAAFWSYDPARWQKRGGPPGG
ncbi:ABC transporter permease [Algihabitans albus]|uniref:ABC transporter permease n=1 Tax=Algihabitans albus TaxID=2164067 RepID=UPI000E5D6B78|nr:ABC transporter permease [Algihabitans albus]